MSEFTDNTRKHLDPREVRTVVSAIPKLRQDLLKWNGWGYKDSYFHLSHGSHSLHFKGNRYPLDEECPLDSFRDWVVNRFNADLTEKREPVGIPHTYPVIVESPEFFEEIKKLKIDYSIQGLDRLIRCHGQTMHDILKLRLNMYTRIPDLVLWPVSHEEVVDIVRLASEYDVVLIPFGGGTSVSGAVTCPEKETRPIVVLDTTQMNRMLWLDKSNLLACFEAGIIGQDLERVLSEEGLTMGHEPDSHEFSSLGGWVATRASGMKKNTYGNIEDIVVRAKMVTCKGTLEKNMCAPRVSCGPDFEQIILGSEGTLGVITQVVIKVRPLPPVKKYGSLVFPNYENGIRCLREIAKRRCQPASIRLIDNEQFQFGQALKGESTWFNSIMDRLKKTVLTRIKGFDLQKMVVATLLFEGDEETVKAQEKLIYQIAQNYEGLAAGATNGQRGYVLTYVIAYIRDLGLDYGIVAESFETSVTWDRCEMLCANVKSCVTAECAKRNIADFMISSRVTQTYDAGACVYFYFGFKYLTTDDPLEQYEEIESKARDEILASGGTISHHHGVGKIRSQWYRQSISDVGVRLYKSTKYELDPNNIFATGNLLTEDEQPTKSKL